MINLKFFRVVIFTLGLFGCLIELNGQGWVRKYNEESIPLDILSTEDGSAWIFSKGFNPNLNLLSKIGQDGVTEMDKNFPFGLGELSRFANGDIALYSIQNDLKKIVRYHLDANMEVQDSIKIVALVDERWLNIEHIPDNSGSFYAMGIIGDSTYITKINGNGTRIWRRSVRFNSFVPLNSDVYQILKASVDGSVYASIYEGNLELNALWHLDANGALISKSFGKEMEVAQDASMYFITQFPDSVCLNHISKTGELLWKKGYSIKPNSDFYLNATTDSCLILTYVSGPYGIRLREKLDFQGQSFGFTYGGSSYSDKLLSVLCTNDNFGNTYFIDFINKFTNTITFDPYFNFSKYSPTGGYLFSKKLPLNILKYNFPLEFIPSNIGSFYLFNDEKKNSPSPISYYHRPVLVKVDTNGVIFPNKIYGRIALDSTQNCLVDTFENGLQNKVLRASSTPENTFYALSNQEGFYEIEVDTGIYTVTLTDIPYFEVCDNQLVVDLNLEPINLKIDFPANKIAICPFLEVNIAAPFLRRCFGNRYYIQYCNTGTAAAPNTQVTVNLSEDVAYTGSSIPGQNIGGNTWQFPIGAVEEGECGAFTLDFLVICDSTVLGQSICATAHITPDSICTPPNTDWSGAQVVVDGVCEGDSVRFSIRNIGLGNMTAAQDFIVIEDNIILREGNFNLSPLDSLIIRTPANGSTWRLEAGQEPTFPVATMPSVSVEGCGQNLGGLFSLGFVTQFGEDDGNPFFSRNCEEIVGSYDPNDKSAQPKGVADAHFILPNTPIEYQIRFQNTGTDTAFTVIIRDTLSDWMERTSFEPGPSSHPYQVAMQGHGILKFTFDNIRLPDSLVNEATSHGFVRYRITPKNETPLGSVVENRAGIYFDFNAPVMTNTVFHTVDTGFLERMLQEVKTQEVIDNQQFIRVSPNPIRAGAYLFFEKIDLEENWFSLHNALGKTVFQTKFSGDKIRLPEGLAEGNYFFEIRNKMGDFWHGRVLIF
jgi:uncharacterized repeat protein (TIGR01451 family)